MFVVVIVLGLSCKSIFFDSGILTFGLRCVGRIFFGNLSFLVRGFGEVFVFSRVGRVYSVRYVLIEWCVF